MQGSSEVLTVEYGFFVRSIDLASQRTLEPFSREETEGKVIEWQQMVLNGLRQPTGGITFWFSEKRPDGGPNSFVISAAPYRRVSVDVVARVVHLTMLQNGKLYQLERPLLDGKQGQHFVGATWGDATGVRLFVDGKEKN